MVCSALNTTLQIGISKTQSGAHWGTKASVGDHSINASPHIQDMDWGQTMNRSDIFSQKCLEDICKAQEVQFHM